ncbi:MAG TPA: YMGG-like glycine zipper-containing protein [Rhodocyclaceae bacterium]|nr:YMGG-like glycine zipper-containing protein [Rhodocyclaceae bacterium]
MPALKRILPVASILLLGACVTYPTGPSVMVLPGTGKSFEQFRFDDSLCRQFAVEQSGGRAAGQAASDSMARSAVAGTAIGAIAGAAIGGNQGAGVGAGTGLLVGSMAGSSAGDTSAYGAQRRFDHAFIQCMYAKGHRVPVSGQFTVAPPAPPPPPAATTAPPPPPPPAPAAPR